jgi:hypothetical protein
MNDSHQILDEWLIEGALGDPPREVAVHAAVCASCARRLGAFDALAAVDVSAGGSPPPLPAPSRLVVGMAWARIGTAVAGTVVAGILVVFGASQLLGWVGNLDLGPGPSEIAGFVTPDPTRDQGTINPDPAVQPSLSAEPSGTPIPSFIPLPSLAPNEQPPDPPSAPFLQLNGVGQTMMSVRWSPGGGGGPVQKWEIWRRTGSGTWFKLGELPVGSVSLTNSGLSPNSNYSFRVRGVNVAWLGPFSNTISASTLPPPPSSAPPTPSPSVEPSIPETPTPTPAPTAPPSPSLSGFVGDLFVQLDWTAVAGIDHYDVYRDGLYLTSTTSTSLIDAGVSYSTDYSYAVKAVTSDPLESGFSNTVSLRTPDPPPPPSP